MLFRSPMPASGLGGLGGGAAPAGGLGGLAEPGMNAPIRSDKFGPVTGGPVNMNAAAAQPNPARMKKGGKVKSTSSYKSGGKVSSASKRGDGCAQRGKTKGRFV